jgi:Heterokaryon incompatibility protein (HET)
MGYAYMPLDHTRREIRLLELDSAQNATTDITCTLHHVSLNSNPEYAALSYAWGSPSETCMIILQGQETRVTENLFAALQRLAQFDKSELSRLWVDAICINQSHDVEKNHQVELMSDIYKRASQVLVWLGPADEPSVRAMRQLRNLGSSSSSTGC